MVKYKRTGACISVSGVPSIPIMGEAHYSRIPVELWPLVLGQMRSMGVTLVSSYVFWNHHQPAAEQAPSFEGQLDLAKFIDLVKQQEMDFCLRIGPWVHGESRYGGFPDWVATGPWQSRTNDPAYLEQVRGWFGAIAEQLGDTKLAVLQIENELYDQPDHLSRLKQLAAEVGIVADLTTATAWGGAEFDRRDFLPVYGGYPDTFWSPQSLGWEPRCGIHYRFQPIRDDALVGEDGRTAAVQSPVDDSRQPYATCELGSGMATAYHRRPLIGAPDVAALGITKIGCGSVWQGWYMLAGGVNPIAAGQPLNESKATGYPNDLPLRDYDFGAPIGAGGQLRESAHWLRLQHSMLDLLSEPLTGSQVTLGEGPLRHSIRTWEGTGGTAALVLFNNHQPATDLPVIDSAQVALPLGELVPPTPVRVANGEFGAWVANLQLSDGIILLSSDLMPIARLGDPAHPIWLLGQTVADSATALIEVNGVAERSDFAGASPPRQIHLRSPRGAATVVVVSRADLPELWVLEDRILLSAASLIKSQGEVVAVCDPSTTGTSIRLVGEQGIECLLTCPDLVELPLTGQPVTSAQHSAVLATPGSAAASAQILRVEIPESAEPLDRLRIRWRGDVLRVVVAGQDPEDLRQVLADQFWNANSELTISVSHLFGHRLLDLYISGFESESGALVAGQPESHELLGICLEPVRLQRIELSNPISTGEGA